MDFGPLNSGTLRIYFECKAILWISVFWLFICWVGAVFVFIFWFWFGRAVPDATWIFNISHRIQNTEYMLYHNDNMYGSTWKNLNIIIYYTLSFSIFLSSSSSFSIVCILYFDSRYLHRRSIRSHLVGVRWTENVDMNFLVTHSAQAHDVLYIGNTSYKIVVQCTSTTS